MGRGLLSIINYQSQFKFTTTPLNCFDSLNQFTTAVPFFWAGRLPVWTCVRLPDSYNYMARLRQSWSPSSCFDSGFPPLPLFVSEDECSRTSRDPTSQANPAAGIRRSDAGTHEDPEGVMLKLPEEGKARITWLQRFRPRAMKRPKVGNSTSEDPMSRTSPDGRLA
ncbi:hypothetical protein L218DRAFT_968121 [Marasmius fiardii PR-910]|nr:hypothetical protein L218DRAFT_968121 [Marasmius fiardii PR-910]